MFYYSYFCGRKKGEIMMNKRLNIDDLSNIPSEVIESLTHVDDDIILINNLNQIPLENLTIQLDMIVILMCCDGKLQLNINGEVFNVRKNNILICTNFHTLTDPMISPDFKCEILAVSMKRVAQICPPLGPNMQYMLFIKDNPLIELKEEEVNLLFCYKTFFKGKINAPKSKYFSESLNGMLQSTFYEVIGVLDRFKKDSNILNCKASDTDNNLVQKFILLLGNDGAKNRTVKYFADELCVSPKYLSTVCHKTTGKTPSEWIRDMLVQRIHFMLLGTDLSCKEIAAQLDFPNASFFGKFTKQYMGCTPLEYRKQNQKRE